MFGALMQIVAYADFGYNYYRNDPNENINFKRKASKKKIRFFYSKLKNQKPKVKAKESPIKMERSTTLNNRHIQEKSFYNNTKIFSNDKLHIPEKVTIKKRIFKLISHQIIHKIEKVLKKNIEFNDLTWNLTHNRNIVFSNIGNKRYSIINNLCKIKNILLCKINIKNTILFPHNFSYKITFMKYIHQLVQCIERQKYIINKININQNLSHEIELKNTICPITFKQISIYIKCNRCKQCYDYDGTYKWFINNPYCACCREHINATPNERYKNLIYISIKKIISIEKNNVDYN